MPFSINNSIHEYLDAVTRAVEYILLFSTAGTASGWIYRMPWNLECKFWILRTDTDLSGYRLFFPSWPWKRQYSFGFKMIESVGRAGGPLGSVDFVSLCAIELISISSWQNSYVSFFLIFIFIFPLFHFILSKNFFRNSNFLSSSNFSSEQGFKIQEGKIE